MAINSLNNEFWLIFGSLIVCLQVAEAGIPLDDLVAYWPLTATYGLRDIGGNEIDATVGSPLSSTDLSFVTDSTAGTMEPLLTIGGDNQTYITMSSPLLALGTSSWTISCFMKLFKYANNSAGGPIISYYNKTIPGLHGLQFSANYQKTYINAISSNNHTMQQLFYDPCSSDLTWKFVSVVYIAESGMYYMGCDGILSSNVLTGFPTETSMGTISVGKRLSTGDFLTGSVACLSIFRTALVTYSFDQIKNLTFKACNTPFNLYLLDIYGNQTADDFGLPQPTVYWPLNQRFSLRDVSGNRRHGAALKSPTFVKGPSDLSANAAQFNNATSGGLFFSKNNIAFELDASSSWTMSCYMLGLSDGPIFSYSNQKIGWSLRNTYGSSVGTLTTTFQNSNTSAGIPLLCFYLAESWNFIALSYNATAQRLVLSCGPISGLRSSTFTVHNMSTASGTFNLGYSQDTGEMFQGTMSCFSIFPVVITSQLFDALKKLCLDSQRPSTVIATTTIPTTTQPVATTTAAPMITAALSTAMLQPTPTTLLVSTKSTSTLNPATLVTTVPQVSIHSKDDSATMLAASKSGSPEAAVFPEPKILVELLVPDMPSDKNTTDVKKLLKECTDFAPTRTAPPNNDLPTKLVTLFAVDRLAAFQEDEESISVFANLCVHWNVTTCNANTTTDKFASMSRLFLAYPNDVWLPSIIFTSSSSDIFMKREDVIATDLVGTVKQTPGAENRTLDLYLSRLGLFSTTCKLDLRKFPFDQQVCKFSFALSHSLEQVQFADIYVACPDGSTTEWSIVGCSHAETDMKMLGSFVKSVTFIMTLKRNPVYYLVNLVLPNAALLTLELGSFLVPPHRPDRPGFAVVLLLSFTVAQSNVLKGIPKNNQRVLLSDYISLLTLIAASITVYEMFACYFANYKTVTANQRVKLCRSLTIRYVRLLDLLAFVVIIAAVSLIQVYAGMVVTGN